MSREMRKTNDKYNSTNSIREKRDTKDWYKISDSINRNIYKSDGRKIQISLLNYICIYVDLHKVNKKRS